MIAPQLARAESGLWVPERFGIIRRRERPMRVVRRTVLYRRPEDFGMFGNGIAGWAPGVIPWFTPSRQLRQLILYEMAPAYDAVPGLQETTFGATGSTVQITNVAAASLLVTGLSTAGDTFTSGLAFSTDNPSDPTAFTVAEVNYDGSGVAGGGGLGFLANASAGTHNVKVTYTGGGFRELVVAEYTGVATSNPKDVSTKNVGQSGATIDTGTTAALAESGELCVSLIAIAASKDITAPGTALLRTPVNGRIGLADEVLGATTGVLRTFGLSTGTNGAGFIATFKAASAGDTSANRLVNSPTINSLVNKGLVA